MRSTRLRLLLAALVLLAAPSALTTAPAVAAPTCIGNPELKPLRPLTVRTAKGEFRFLVEVADTDRERELGMMCRRSLAPDRGMLFDFGTPREAAMWMKNTYIPLDMLFADAAGIVRKIHQRAVPLSEAIISSDAAVRAVLELNGGTAARLGLKEGDRLVHPMFR